MKYEGVFCEIAKGRKVTQVTAGYSQPGDYRTLVTAQMAELVAILSCPGLKLNSGDLWCLEGRGGAETLKRKKNGRTLRKHPAFSRGWKW